MTTFWCEHAWLGHLERGVTIEVRDGLISSVLAGRPAPTAGAVRLSGLTLPGLANAHSHAFQRALRGRTHGQTGTFWTWREAMYELAGSLDLARFRAVTRDAFSEMALAGIALVGEFHYLHGDAFGEAVLGAAEEVGVRLTLIDACYLHGGLPAFRDADALGWAARVDRLKPGAGARLAAAIHSVRAVDPQAMRVVSDWARERGAPLHAHVSEQPAENTWCLEQHGATPTAVLHGAGALSESFTAVHLTHVTADDLARLAAAGARCCLCPTTERDLADGVGRARAMREAGVRLALGSDSNAIVEPLEEARAVELDERLVSGRRGSHSGADLLWAATRGGYEALGWDGGEIAPGRLADLTVLRRDGPRLAGIPDEHLIDGVVFAGGAGDVTDVLVAGRFIVRDGTLVR